MAHPFRIDWSACFLFALGLLVVPIPPLLACILAAAFHELCHMIAVRLIGIPVYSLEITALGCRMETGPMQKKQELICAAAGPAGSLLLAACMSYFPLTGLCAGIQGVYNLLPLYPMDGGRILRCIAGEKTADFVEKVILLGFLLLSGILLFQPESGMIAKFICLIPVLNALRMKNSLQTPVTKSTIALPKTKR